MSGVEGGSNVPDLTTAINAAIRGVVSRAEARRILEAAAGVVSAGLPATAPTPAAPTEADAQREAYRRYDGDTIIDENTGEPTSHDDWGYAECQRHAFIAGVAWASVR